MGHGARSKEENITLYEYSTAGEESGSKNGDKKEQQLIP
jgi:hypothetical protein